MQYAGQHRKNCQSNRETSRKTNMQMKNTPLYLIFALITVFQCCGAKTSESTLHRYITDFMQPRSDADTQFALSLIPAINKYSHENNIDPLLTAYIIAAESSFNPSAVGDDNDTGLMQVVKGGVCARKQDLTTPEGQIKAGVECLALSRDQCNGTLKQTLTMYASGKCRSNSKRTQRKINYRLFQYQKLKGIYYENSRFQM